MVDGVLGGDRSDRAAFRPLRTAAACRRADGRDGLGSGPQELLDDRRAPRRTPPPTGCSICCRGRNGTPTAVRDDLRDYVVDAFGDPGAILVVDETGDREEGHRTRVGVQRQYTGTAGRIENSQVAVYLTYAAPRGHALIDRALYLPKSWAEDPGPLRRRRNPTDRRSFATKPTLARALIDRAVAAEVPAAWVAGDEVYGADPALRAAIRGHGLGYVLAVAANRRVPTDAGPIRVDGLPAMLPGRAWQKHSAGAGSHGPRATTPGPGSRCCPKTTPTPAITIC